MSLILAEKKDVKEIIEIINKAKQFLKESGMRQWQGAYPAESDIILDIDKSRGYVYKIKDELIAYLCLDFEGDPVYEDIKGQWLTNDYYGAIHRLAVSDKYRGQGIISKVLEEVYTLAKEKDIASIKIDTGDDNKIMHHIVTKNGFKECGQVMQAGKANIAYEKII